MLLDPSSREHYSLAECVYRVRPLGAVLPASREDVLEVLRVARSEAIPVTARGAGSAVAGQSLGAGLILDFSRHLNRVLEVCPEEKWARVEPGVVLQDLNARLGPLGLRFAPDPSSGAFCTLGGMIANNAGGARSVRYGATRDQVLSLTVALTDGRVIETRPIRREEVAAGGGDRQVQLARGLVALVDPRRAEIERAAPRVRRISSGYELLRSAGEKAVDLAQLLVGSEGTLALILEARVRLAPTPKAVATALVHFDDLEAMGQGVLTTLRHDPSALEALDRSFLDLIHDAGTEEVRELPDTTEAVLVVEVEGETGAAAAAVLDRIQDDLRTEGVASGMIRGLDPVSRRRIWEIRKAASPILSSRQGKLRNTRFIEDACVPTSRLPEFLGAIRRLLAEHRLEAAIFGHAGDAILHVNPMLDPADPNIGPKMERVAEEYGEMVLGLGGALSGEHGDGRLRTPFLSRAYGGVTELFRGVKKLFDPEGILNPGIKVHDGRSRMSDCLDLGPRPSEKAVPVW